MISQLNAWVFKVVPIRDEPDQALKRDCNKFDIFQFARLVITWEWMIDVHNEAMNILIFLVIFRNKISIPPSIKIIFLYQFYNQFLYGHCNEERRFFLCTLDAIQSRLIIIYRHSQIFKARSTNVIAGFIPGDKSLKPPFEKVISLHYTHKTFTEGRLHNTEMSYFSFQKLS
jgi:hypothetical protein